MAKQKTPGGRIGTRIKFLILIAVAVAAGLGVLASTQIWYLLRLVPSAGHDVPVDVQGSVACAALMALSLAALALVAALAIAGSLIRFVLGVLGVLLGGCVLLAVSLSVADPIAASVGAVTAVTGVAGGSPIAHLVARVDTSLWPAVALAGGVILLLASLGVLVTGSRWPLSARKYQAVRFEAAGDAAADFAPGADAAAGVDEAAQGSARDAAIDSWDDLSRGHDPTA